VSCIAFEQQDRRATNAKNHSGMSFDIQKLANDQMPATPRRPQHFAPLAAPTQAPLPTAQPDGAISKPWSTNLQELILPRRIARCSIARILSNEALPLPLDREDRGGKGRRAGLPPKSGGEEGRSRKNAAELRAERSFTPKRTEIQSNQD